jgi:1-acyl-sn-glycerol-3-phosphate acyltransferase
LTSPCFLYKNNIHDDSIDLQGIEIPDMNRLISQGLWLVGGSFFMVSFIILAACLMILPRKKTFGVAQFLFAVLLKLMGIKLIVTGKEHIKPDHTYLIMGNHQSLFDLFVIPCAIPLCFTGIEAAYHFSIPIWGYLIRKWGCIPIERNNLDKAKQSIELAKQTLLNGLSIAVLPEGHRTRTGKISPFKKGPFHLAKNTRADILPFGTKGLFEFQQKGSLNLRPGIVHVNIGKPISHGEYKTLSVEGLRDKLFMEIMKLSQ